MSRLDLAIVARRTVAKPTDRTQCTVSVFPCALHQPDDLLSGRPQRAEFAFDPEPLLPGFPGNVPISVAQIGARTHERETTDGPADRPGQRQERVAGRDPATAGRQCATAEPG